MPAIRIRKMIESDTVTLPELKHFIGNTVEIVIEEKSEVVGFTPGAGDWDEVLAATQNLENYDNQAQIDQDAPIADG